MKKREPKKIGKKGNLDMILVVVVGFVAVLMLFVMHIAWRKVSIPINAITGDNQVSRDAIGNATQIIDSFDTAIVVIFILLVVVTMILAFMINTHPVMFFISFLMLLIVGLLAVKFSNIFGTITAAPLFENETATFGASSYLLGNYPKFIIIAFFIISIITYAKVSSRNSGGQL